MGSLSLLAQAAAEEEVEEGEEEEVGVLAAAAAPERDFLMALMAFRRCDMAASVRVWSVFMSSEAE
jgi:hypothetical protein